MKTINEILNQIAEERARQDAKWGVQNYPLLCPIISERGSDETVKNRMCENYEIPTENRAKQICEHDIQSRNFTWGCVLVEEVSEAISCVNDPQNMRKELIQVAAVAVAMIEQIDRSKNENLSCM